VRRRSKASQETEYQDIKHEEKRAQEGKLGEKVGPKEG
jgi:hypothetical protein